MNQLSWLIYLAGTSGYIGGWLAFFAVVTFILCLFLTLWYFFSATDKNSEHPTPPPPRAAPLMYVLFIFFLVTSTAMPNRETVLAIAASEMGEKLANNAHMVQTTNKAFAALDRWLDSQIAAEEPKKESKP
jgi:uncharacterized membrane protein YcgQ (UPF0703/DUF1980 family)